VVVIDGAGPCLSAGHDLSEMTDRPLAFYQELFTVCTELMETIQGIPQPVIAKVHGFATAAGCQLVAACDLALATPNARFATSGVKYGLFCSTPMVALTRAIGRKAAMEMLLTGDLVDAATALDLGLVNKVVADGELDAAVDRLAAKIVAKSPLALAIGKEAFYKQAELGLEDAYRYASEVMTRNMLARDAERGIDAFIAKQPMPEWEGR
jgi:enoyl-CoA hydratase/carnithine racemase